VGIAGRSINYSAVEKITVDQLATFKLTTPSATDGIALTRAGSQFTLSGSSGSVTLPSIILTNTPLITLDLAANDAGAGNDFVGLVGNGTLPNPLPRLDISAGTGTNNLSVTSGTWDMQTSGALGGANLDVAVNTGDLRLYNSPSLHSLSQSSGFTELMGSGNVLRVGPGTLSANRLDLIDNDMIVQATAANRQSVLASIFNSLKSARNSSPRWTGLGITSSAAANDPRHITGLAAILNDNGAGGTLYSTFDGQSVDINSILVKYTYDGDANLDGQVNADDYAAIDAGFATHATGYAHGDFNYSGGQPNSDDYFAIDRSFSDQGAVLAGPSAPEAPASATLEAPTAAASPAPTDTSDPTGSAGSPPAAAPTTPTPQAPASTALSIATDSDSLKRTKHRHHKRTLRPDPVWNPKTPNSDALTRFLHRF
jgi:hypothetical protein